MFIKCVETYYEDWEFCDPLTVGVLYGVYKENTDYPHNWYAVFVDQQDALNYVKGKLCEHD